MVKIIANQPYYFPQLHWWERARRGTTVLLDDVLRSPTHPVNRAVVSDGIKARALTVPIPSSCRMARIDEIPTFDDYWRIAHRNKLHAYYRHAPHFRQVMELFDRFLAASTYAKMMVDVIEASIFECASYLSLNLHIVRGQDLDLGETKRSARMILACKRLGGTTLVLGGGSRAYLAEDAPLYRLARIGVEIQDWSCPVPNLSVLDAVAHLGRDRVAEIVLGEMQAEVSAVG